METYYIFMCGTSFSLEQKFVLGLKILDLGLKGYQSLFLYEMRGSMGECTLLIVVEPWIKGDSERLAPVLEPSPWLRSRDRFPYRREVLFRGLCLRLSYSWIIIAGGQFIFSPAFNGVPIKAPLLCGEFEALQRGTLRAYSRDFFVTRVVTMCMKVIK